MKATVILSVVAVFLVPSGQCKMQVVSNHEANAKMWQHFVSTRAIEKRQLFAGTCTLEELTAGHPQDCESELQNTYNAVQSSLNRTFAAGLQNQTAATAFLNQYSSGINTISEFFCRPRCGNPYITSYIRCGLPEVSDTLRRLCTRNNTGDLCYERIGNIIVEQIRTQFICINVTRASSSCTANCRDALLAISEYGCCINVYNTTFVRSAIDSVNMVFGSAMNITSSVIHYDLWSRCGVTTPGFCNLEESTLEASSAETLNFMKVLILLTSVVMVMLL